MKLPEIALKNHQFSLVLVILLVLFGLVSFSTMPRSEDPQVSPAASSVIVVYPGASPADMENLVINPLEEKLNELDDIKRFTSRAQDGLALLQIEFMTGADPDEKYSEVVQQVNRVRPDLPQNIFDLNVVKWTVSDVQILELALYSEDAEYRRLEQEAEILKTSLEKTSGVKRVKIWAYPEQEVRISLDLAKLGHLGIPLSQVIGSIQSANQNIPGGYVDAGLKRFNIKTSGSLQTIEDIKQIVVHADQGQVVILKQIADVNFGYADASHLARYRNKRALLITVNQKEGTNIFNIADQLDQKIEDFKQSLPANIALVSVFDQSESVASRLNNFFSSLFQGLLLVGLVIFLALGVRASWIIIVVIPVSFSIAVGLLDLSGFGLEQMSIAGLVIALGLLVDNAIVVIENISRFIRQGHSKFEAAVQGTAQIAWAIVSATATTVLAFVPMMMMQNITGDFIRSMPVTVVYALSASLLISLILTPWLSAKYLTPKSAAYDSYLHKVLNREVENRYRNTLDRALRYPGRLLTAVVIIFFASSGLFLAVGVSFFPKAEKPMFIINIDTPESASLEQTNQVARHVEAILQGKEQITDFITNVGRGNPRIYYNIIPKNISANHAQMLVKIDQYRSQEFAELISDLRAEFDNYPGAKIELKEFEQGPPVEAPVALRIIGENLDVLKRISKDAEKLIREEAGTLNINNPFGSPKTDLRIQFNKEKAAVLGVPLVEADRTVRLAVAGMTVETFRDADGKEYDIVLRMPQGQQMQIEDLNQIRFSTLSGAQIPLNQIADVRFETSPVLVTHYNMDRNVTLTSDVQTGYSVDQITRNIRNKLEAYDWPKGYRFNFGGEVESREESFGGMLQAVLVALIGIFAVLVLQFRSFRQPLIVFSAIPLAMIGSILALLITGYSFSFTAFIGLSSLVGIVINNSIILVDFTNQLRRDGMDITEALKNAGETRFLPIVLTTFTTVGGLLPLTLGGGSLWAPMGWTIIGGLLMSTVLTLIVVPVLYKLFVQKDTI